MSTLLSGSAICLSHAKAQPRFRNRRHRISGFGNRSHLRNLRPGRLALVLADIAGKGVSGALLMANLQANLRSQYALAVDDLPRFLASVNRLFHENSGDASYATLFFADYDDTSRKLRYANCGHLPPRLLRACDSFQDREPNVEWLRSTCTVMGLFEDWRCDIAEVPLAPASEWQEI